MEKKGSLAININPEDSWAIDIKPDKNEDVHSEYTNEPVPEGFIDGIKNSIIIKRYREKEKEYRDSPQTWRWSRKTSIVTNPGDTESAINYSKLELYNIKLEDNQILNIVKKIKESGLFTEEQIANGVLINFINARNEVGYIIVPYDSLRYKLFGFGGKSRKTKNRKRKKRKTKRHN